MARVDDVAAAIVARTGQVDTWKLQKLAYYCQAWHLVWESEPLFPERIEAWAGGPVIPVLYEHHRGQYTIKEWPYGDSARLQEQEASTVRVVVGSYGKLAGWQLRQLTHKEPPWIEAREGLAPEDRSNREIKLDTMSNYYGGLADDDAAVPVEELAQSDG